MQGHTAAHAAWQCPSCTDQRSLLHCRRTAWISIDTLGRSTIFQADKRALLQVCLHASTAMDSLSDLHAPAKCSAES